LIGLIMISLAVLIKSSPSSPLTQRLLRSFNVVKIIAVRLFFAAAMIPLSWLLIQALLAVHGTAFSQRSDPRLIRSADLLSRFLLSEMFVIFIAFCAAVLVFSLLPAPQGIKVLDYLGNRAFRALLICAIGCAGIVAVVLAFS